MQNLSLMLLPVLATQKGAGASLIKPLGHHELLLVLVQLSLLLLVARGLGEFMRRINQPPVVGELLAGVLLGPSLFGLLFPDLQAHIFPKSQEQSDLLSVISWLGVLFLLIVTGLETDLKLILRKGKTALLISLGGIIVPFITGFGLGWLLPDSFLADPEKRLVFSLFIATAMSISAVPVIAKVLMDLNLIRRDIGQVTLAAGMTDDTIGWILLSVVSGLASSGKFDFGTIFHSVSAAVLFLGIAFTIGRNIVDQILRWVDDYVGGIAASMSVVLVLSLSAAAFTHALGLEAALGAFVLGILAGQSRRFSSEAGHMLEVFTASFLAPIFFAAAGLKVNLLALLVPQTLIFGLIVLAVACIGKFTGAYLGSRVGGLSHWEALAMGSGMNARGAMEIVVATIGLSLGVLNPQMYSIIVMVAIVTSLMAPALLRFTLSKVVMGEEEARRLEQEEQYSRSFIKRIHRILVPTSGGSNIQLAAQLVGYMAHQNQVEVTALYALSDKQPPKKARRTATQVKDTAAEEALACVTEEMQLSADTTLQIKTESGHSKAEVILNEANKNYDLIVLGASEQIRPQKALFNLLVDRVVQEAPCATMVVKSHLPQPQGETCKIAQQQLKNILVPTVGTEYSKNAVEVASTIAAHTGAVVTIVNVINLPQVEYILYEQRSLAPVKEIAEDLLEQQAAIGRNLGADVQTYILQGSSPEKEILKFAQSKQADLIVLGSNIRMVTGRVFFGHRVDAILNKAHCPVAVITGT
ncbi:MAG: sodium:proton antiporter [Nostoc sp. GBBB01]|uniref:Cation:proton antiporter n=1 Tax=Nostoc punctiforme FACHB-252 TaxID=1357509 RepID=A0ABR8HDH8_NOSPU|nr:cation:proton antiporter [Nostoc punctiforme]MBD2613366.1 cation:proton antiporter [Nostoc punctiforme FACHB-252]MBL1199297.1 sodium:proton antiporter [Nostoc sp. GBBB01]